MNRITRLVIEREVRDAFSRRSFRLILLSMMVISIALAVVPDLFDRGGPTDLSLGVVGDAPAAVVDGATQALDTYEIELTNERVASEGVLRQSVTDGDIDLGLVWSDSPVIIRRGDGQETAVQVMQQVIRARQSASVFDRAGVDESVVVDASTVPGADIESVDTDRVGRFGAATAITVVLYIVILILANTVATSVATEKSNRVSEVLLAVAPPRRLLYGKVIAAVLMGLAVLVAVAIPQVVKMIIGGGTLPEGIGAAIITTFPWFIGGAALYLLVAACLGAMVERTEEVAGAVTPLTIVLVGVYVVSFPMLESDVGAIFGILPISSPVVLPGRMAVGSASWLEIVASLIALVIAVYVVARFAVVLYSRAIVRTGKRLKFSDLRQP